MCHDKKIDKFKDFCSSKKPEEVIIEDVQGMLACEIPHHWKKINNALNDMCGKYKKQGKTPRTGWCYFLIWLLRYAQTNSPTFSLEKLKVFININTQRGNQRGAAYLLENRVEEKLKQIAGTVMPNEIKTGDKLIIKSKISKEQSWEISNIFCNFLNSIRGTIASPEFREQCRDSHSSTPEDAEKNNLQVRTLLDAGMNSSRLKQFEEALRHFNQALEIEPLNATVLLEIGRVYFTQGEFIQACKYLKKALKCKPENEEEILLLLGKALIYRGEYNDAIKRLKGKDSAEIYELLATAYKRDKNFTKAALCYKKAVEAGRSPRSQLLILYAECCRFAREYVNGLRALRQVVKLEPSNAEAHAEMGKIYFDRKQYVNACECLTKAAIFDPENKDIAFWQGKALVENEKYSSAIKVLCNLLDASPDDYARRATTHRYLADAYMGNEDYKAAERHYVQAIELKRSPSLKLFLSLGECYCYMNQSKAALKIFEEAQKKFPNAAGPRRQIGKTYFDLREYDLARKYLQQALNMTQKCEYTMYWLGKTYMQLKEYSDAIAQFSNLIVINDCYEKDVELLCLFAKAYQGKQDYNRAESYCKRILKEEPQEAECYICVGEIYFDREFFEKALDMFKRALKIEPKNTENLINLWAVYMREGSYDKASGMAKRLDSRNYFYHLLLGFISFDTDDLHKAIQFFEQAYEVSNKKKEIKQILEAVKDEVTIDGRKTHPPSSAKKENIIKQCENGIERDPQNPQLYKRLGDEYRKIGRNGECLRAYQKYFLLGIREGMEEN